MSAHVVFGDDGQAYMVDWSDAAYARMAAQLSAITGHLITPLDRDDPYGTGYSGYRIKETETHYIEVHVVLVNHRLVSVPRGRMMPVADRFWCYEGLGSAALAAAVHAAIEWDGAPDTEPVGWVRRWPERQNKM